MPKTKISEFSATPANNTDIDSINIAEGCAPSGINDAIRELMAQLKDFQTGAVGDSFNGPVGTTTAAAGAFTTLSASSTVSGTGFSTYLASPPAIGGTAAAAVSATTLTTSSTVTLNGGTANGVAYLNGSKVVTSGSALTFDGSFANLTLTSGTTANGFLQFSNSADGGTQGYIGDSKALITGGANSSLAVRGESNILFGIASAEGMRLTSTGLGIGTSSPATKLQVYGGALTVGDEATYAARFSNNSNKGVVIGYDTTNNVGHIGSINPATAWTDLVINANGGNLGLGVTPSAWSTLKALQVGYSSLGTLTSNTYLNNNTYYNGTNWIYSTTAPSGKYQINDNVHSWHTAPSGTAGNAITFTQALTLTADGNLAVGTTASTFRLVSNVQSGANRDVFAAQIEGASNGFQIKWNHATSTTRVNISNLPTSATGLASGDLYVLAGALMVA